MSCEETVNTNKKISIKAAILLIIGAVLTTIIIISGVFFAFGGTSKVKFYAKINELTNLIDKDFLFEVDENKLLDYMGIGLVAGLEDDYSRYLTQDSYKQKLESDSGNLVGIGVMTDAAKNAPYLTVITVYEDSPASESQLQIGDIVKAVDGKDFAELEEGEDPVSLIKGEENTALTLTIDRDGETFDVPITRRTVEVPSVTHKMIDNVEYIRITDFNDNSFAQFKVAVDNATAENARGIIFDLRDNGGGALAAATEMLDYLCPEGTLVTTTDKNGNVTDYAKSDKNEITLPMITIANEGTASAAELFVATLKDFGKAKSVGTKTFGKGIMQSTYPLSGDSAVKLTTSYFNPPKSENFHKKGIEPDYPVELSETEKNPTDIGNTDTDRQLQKAVEML